VTHPRYQAAHVPIAGLFVLALADGAVVPFAQHFGVDTVFRRHVAAKPSNRYFLHRPGIANCRSEQREHNEVNDLLIKKKGLGAASFAKFAKFGGRIICEGVYIIRLRPKGSSLQRGHELLTLR